MDALFLQLQAVSRLTPPPNCMTVYATIAGQLFVKMPNQDPVLLNGGGQSSVATGKIFTVNNTITLAGTDGTTLDIGNGDTLNALAETAPFEIGGGEQVLTINESPGAGQIGTLTFVNGLLTATSEG